jgi:hypothetical protein
VSSPQSDEKLKQLVAIASASSLAALPLALPLWRTEVLFSVASLSPAILNATAGRSVWRSLSQTVNTEGVRSLYRGALPLMLHYASLNALRLHLKQRTGLSSIERVGVVAAASAVAHPLLLVATRLAVRTGPVESIGVKAVAGEFSSIARTAGLRGFAPGLPLSLLLSVGNVMCLSDKNLAWPWFAAALPLTVVQRHLMVQGVDGIPQRYRNSLHTASVIVQNEGVGGLVRGAVPFILRTGLYTVVTVASAMLVTVAATRQQ